MIAMDLKAIWEMLDKSEALTSPNKRIIVCCDGTWNEPAEASEDPKDKNEPTNVLKFVRAVSPLDDNAIAQIIYYDEGVGTRWGVDRFLGGGLGTGLSLNVQEAYRFIANNYRKGDHIFLLGFSRGAYTVRSLAGFIGAVGLLAKRYLAFAADAYELYRLPLEKRKSSTLWDDYKKLEVLPPERVPIDFIGVWDTVGALGAPTPLVGRWTRPWVSFHNTQLGDHVHHAYHALAIDERRRPFQPDLWTGKGANTKTVVQAWFPGVHSNVGSSYKDTSLSSIALNWMMHRAREHRLQFLPYAVDGILKHTVEVLRSRAQNGIAMDSFSWEYQALRALRVSPYVREIGPSQNGDIRKASTVVPEEMIHESALDRFGRKVPFKSPGNLETYAPENLENAKNDLPVFNYDAPVP